MYLAYIAKAFKLALSYTRNRARVPLLLFLQYVIACICPLFGVILLFILLFSYYSFKLYTSWFEPQASLRIKFDLNWNIGFDYLSLDIYKPAKAGGKVRWGGGGGGVKAQKVNPPPCWGSPPLIFWIKAYLDKSPSPC